MESMREYTLSEGEIKELRKILSEESGNSAFFIRTEITKNLLPDLFKEALFVTEDNVEIFEGDSIYPVSDTFQILYTSHATIKDKKVRAFSTKEAAKKWIKENKPKYSENDILNAVNNWAMSPIQLQSIISFLERNGAR